ncbi:hypothetical protein GIB67_035560, partial [Kingdonia uniflora]
DAEFAQIFAPNCGVQVSSLAPITGRLLGCRSHYMQASEFFSNVMIQNNKSLDIVQSKNHTEVGAAVTGTDGGSPYFWCVLFSNGKNGSTFVIDGGVAKTQHPGCFSGTSDDCSSSPRYHQSHLWRDPIIGIFLAVAFGKFFWYENTKICLIYSYYYHLSIYRILVIVKSL